MDLGPIVKLDEQPNQKVCIQHGCWQSCGCTDEPPSVSPPSLYTLASLEDPQDHVH